MKTVEIHLGYFKQGDDLCHCLEATSNNVDAFRMHAKMLYECAKHLDKIADVLNTHPKADMKIDAGTHFIGIDGDEKVLNILVEKDLATVSEWEDEEEDEDEENDEEDDEDYANI